MLKRRFIAINKFADLAHSKCIFANFCASPVGTSFPKRDVNHRRASILRRSRERFQADDLRVCFCHTRVSLAKTKLLIGDGRITWRHRDGVHKGDSAPGHYFPRHLLHFFSTARLSVTTKGHQRGNPSSVKCKLTSISIHSTTISSIHYIEIYLLLFLVTNLLFCWTLRRTPGILFCTLFLVVQFL